MKKATKITLIILIVLAIAILIQSIYSYKKINDLLVDKNVFSQSENVQKSYKNYQSLQCKFGLLNTEHAFVNYLHYVYPERGVDRESYSVGFFNLSRTNIFLSNWQTSYTGGTTIKNTTFPELVKMVKEDCSQFQRAKGDIRDETINWSYSKYVPEVPKTQKEIREEERSLEIFKKKIESGEITRTELEGFVEIKE